MRDHRVPLLGVGWRRVDPEKSRDPQVQLVLAGLRELAAGPAPEPTFRAELRAQLVAITPRIVAEGDPEAAPVLRAPKPAPRPARASASGGGLAVATSAGPRRALGGTVSLPFSLRRVVAVTTCAFVVLALMLGGGVALSRHAVPGDTLYGLKRASERVQLATDSDSERASDLLRFAGYRADEVRTLISRGQASAAGAGIDAAGGVSAHTQSLIDSTLDSADSDVRQASRLLSTKAVDSASAAPLTAMTEWVPGQLSKLHEIWSAAGSTAVKTQVSRSVSLVTSAGTRAKALSAKVDCGCLKQAPSDSLGPKPCVLCGTTRPSTTGRGGSTSVPSVPVTSGDPVHPIPSHPATSGAGKLGRSTKTGTSGDGGTHSTPTPTPTPPISVPTGLLPTKVPISVNSCGISVSIIINVGVNLCPSP